jgi:hypothetical protein
VEEEGRGDDQGTDEDASEGAAFLAGGEIVRVYEDYDEGFEPGVGEAVDEGDVEAQAKADGLGGVKGEGAGRESSSGCLLPSVCSAAISGSPFNFSFSVGLRCRECLRSRSPGRGLSS